MTASGSDSMRVIVDAVAAHVRHEINAGRGKCGLSANIAGILAGVSSGRTSSESVVRENIGTAHGCLKDPTAMFIGACPRSDEPDGALPYSGRNGELLRKMIAAMRLDEKEVLLAYMSDRRPVQGKKADYSVYIPWVSALVASASPLVIVIFGDETAKTLLGVDRSVSDLHGKWYLFEGVSCLPTFDPSYLNRFPAAKRVAWNDLKTVMAKIGKSVSAQAHDDSAHGPNRETHNEAGT